MQQRPNVADLLAGYRPRTPTESADLDRVRQMVHAEDDPWSRSTPLHLTASALIVHPDSGRVLLRWHTRQQAWLQVGGHADPGESDPIEITLREGHEETGLPDLAPWPGPDLTHLVIVRVPANDHEPDHEHADLRFVLATAEPDAARPEHPDAPLRWLSLPGARRATAEANVHESLSRVAGLLAG